MKNEKLVIATGGKGSKILKITPVGEKYIINILKDIHMNLSQTKKKDVSRKEIIHYIKYAHFH